MMSLQQSLPTALASTDTSPPRICDQAPNNDNESWPSDSSSHAFHGSVSAHRNRMDRQHYRPRACAFHPTFEISHRSTAKPRDPKPRARPSSLQRPTCGWTIYSSPLAVFSRLSSPVDAGHLLGLLAHDWKLGRGRDTQLALVDLACRREDGYSFGQPPPMIMRHDWLPRG
ncbi:hypothetical protein BDN71DRAFT_1453105 [Pleurotus eryngii]|uniref:Uncharacterized protein n=1 Tax=Pleurotus eryngii TaxID=5323 RepID=A0A9P6DCY2_PLEER|nr:hypothetical protein BDN71DRAFT_1453105 [Pleurotus eryngii]